MQGGGGGNPYPAMAPIMVLERSLPSPLCKCKIKHLQELSLLSCTAFAVNFQNSLARAVMHQNAKIFSHHSCS